MHIIKKDNIITIELSPVETEAIDYFIHKRGINVLDEYFGFFFNSRVETKKIEEREELYRVVTDAERKELLKRLP